MVTCYHLFTLQSRVVNYLHLFALLCRAVNYLHLFALLCRAVTRRRFGTLLCWPRRAGAKQHSTGVLHLFIRISGGSKKAQKHKLLGFFGDPPEIRTPDPLLKRQLLYLLS